MVRELNELGEGFRFAVVCLDKFRVKLDCLVAIVEGFLKFFKLNIGLSSCTSKRKRLLVKRIKGYVKREVS